MISSYNINKLEISKESKNSIEICENLCNIIKKNLTLRNQYITLLEKISKNKLEIEISSFIEFFEKMFDITYHPYKNKSQYTKFLNDYILRELFLYSIAIPLKNKHYEFIKDLLYSPYYFEDYLDKACRFSELDQRGDIYTNDLLKKYFNSQNKNYHNPLGYLMISNLHPNYKKDNLVDADLLCFYITILYPNLFKDWFPFLWIYKESNNISNKTIPVI